MDNSASLISKENSTCIKGILIFLIILGHNMCFTIPLEKWGVMSYLYCFHVQSFFILPFLYGSKPLTKDSITKNLVRLYWPYFVIAMILTLCMGVYNHFASFSIPNIIKLLLGGETILRTMCGYAALWFLPVMLLVVLLKDLYYQSGILVKWGLIGISFVLNIIFVVDWEALSSPILSEWLYSPVTALRFLGLGIFARYIMHSSTFRKVTLTKISIVLLFIIGTYIYFAYVIHFANKDANPIYRLLTVMMPVPFLLIIVFLVEKASIINCKAVYKLGELSLPIYLISPLVGYAAYFTLLHFNLVCWESGIIMQFIITTIAYMIAKYIIKGRIRQFLLPRSIDELKKSLGFFL